MQTVKVAREGKHAGQEVLTDMRYANSLQSALGIVVRLASNALIKSDGSVQTLSLDLARLEALIKQDLKREGLI